MTRRGWRFDVLTALAAICFVLVTSALGSPHIPQRGATLLLELGAAVLLVAVRRHPLPVLLAEAALLVGSALTLPYGTAMPLFAGGFALGYHSYRSGWLGAILGWLIGFAVTVFSVAVLGEPTDPVFAGKEGMLRVVVLAMLVATPVVFGRYLRGVRVATLVAEERVREADARRVVETRAARLAERAAVARDLHDIVAHHIAGVAVRAGSAQYAARHTGRVDDAVEALGDIRATSARVVEELRALLAVLRDPEAVASDAPLVEPEQVLAEAERLTRAAGLDVRVTGVGELAAAPLVARTTAARVAREGLTNALKHAGPGAVVAVEIRTGSDGMRVEIRDSGPAEARAAVVPPPGLPSSGHGLAGLRERVGLLGGTLTAGPADGGWRLVARLPMGRDEA
ncbi:sensor histidine kinase [Plantactinospora sp. GCM10030261]|uniref:sensor histidine kinase n=1 Tax=Plantactinospora sp. GCM10030261 TaxID=3273420 RepID=UPI0036234D65